MIWINHLIIKSKIKVKQPVSFVFNFIEEQHFQVRLVFQCYSYMIISSGHCRWKQAESQGNAQTRPVYSIGCFTLKSPENKDGSKKKLHCIKKIDEGRNISHNGKSIKKKNKIFWLSECLQFIQSFKTLLSSMWRWHSINQFHFIEHLSHQVFHKNKNTRCQYQVPVEPWKDWQYTFWCTSCHPYPNHRLI